MRLADLVDIVIKVIKVLGVIVILIALSTFPAAYRTPREAVRCAQCVDNLKQIALALNNYEQEYNALPPAYTVDADGRPLHSWRTLILPYLEEECALPVDRPREALERPGERRGVRELAFRLSVPRMAARRTGLR